MKGMFVLAITSTETERIFESVYRSTC